MDEAIQITQNGRDVTLPFRFYVSSADAIPALMAAKQLEAFAKLLPQSRSLMEELLGQGLPRETVVFFDKLIPGGSKEYFAWLKFICPTEKAALALIGVLKEWSMEHPYLLTTICMTGIVCYTAQNIAGKYFDAERQETIHAQISDVAQELAEKVNIPAETFLEMAKNTLPVSNTTMRSVADITAPIKASGGFAKVGTKENGILLPESLIKVMPTPDEILPEPNDIIIPMTSTKVRVISSNLKKATSGWSVEFVEENSYGSQIIRTTLDETRGATTEKMMYKEFVVIDGELQCKAKGARLIPKLLIVHSIHETK